MRIFKHNYDATESILHHPKMIDVMQSIIKKANKQLKEGKDNFHWTKMESLNFIIEDLTGIVKYLETNVRPINE